MFSFYGGLSRWCSPFVGGRSSCSILWLIFVSYLYCLVLLLLYDFSAHYYVGFEVCSCCCSSNLVQLLFLL